MSVNVLLYLWVALLLVLVRVAANRPAAGGTLTLAYFLGLSLIHVPGMLAHLGPVDTFANGAESRAGFEMTMIGMTAFVAGAAVLRERGPGPAAAPYRLPWSTIAIYERVGWRMFIAGLASYFVLLPIARFLPSLTSVISGFGTLLILGIWLKLIGASAAGNTRQMILTLGMLPALPIATLAAIGFLGYGVYWVLSVLAFLFVIAHQRSKFYLATPLVFYLGLSLFVTYMGQRSDIRDLVWHQDAGVMDRLDRISRLVTDFQLLDLDSNSQRVALDGRLNQNALVGAGIIRHQTGLAELSYGGTVPVWVFIPRAIWPEKPPVAGSGTLVSDFTGIRFAEGTSVGVGQVLEFYMNFGTLGVVVGFFIWGLLIRWLDRQIMRALAQANIRRFLLHAMPGLTLMQPGGSLLEISVGAVAALVAAQLLLQTHVFAPRPARGASVAS